MGGFSSSPTCVCISRVMRVSSQCLKIVTKGALCYFTQSLRGFVPVIRTASCDSMRISRLLPLSGGSF